MFVHPAIKISSKSQGETAAMIAAINGHRLAILLLIESGADISKQDNRVSRRM